MSLIQGTKEKRQIKTPTNAIIHIHSSNFDDGKQGEVMKELARILRINDVKYEELDSSGMPHFRLFPSTIGKMTKVCDSLKIHAINYAKIIPAS